MNKQTPNNQSSVPTNATNEAQTTLNQGRHYSGGDAILGSELAAEQRQLSDEAFSDPIATDIAGNTDTDDPTNAEVFTTTGAYPVDAERLQKDYSSSQIGNYQDTNT